MPGIGSVTAAGLLSKMPELGTIDGKAAASLAGLAPMTRESGTWKGRSFIHGGRARPRRLLYMASVSAIRHNPDFVRKYRELRERGKRRRWPSRRSCARCWCWPTPCLGTIGSGRRTPSVRRVARRRKRLRWSWSLCEGSVSDRSQGSRTNGTPISRTLSIRGETPADAGQLPWIPTPAPATSPKHQPGRRAKVRRDTIFATWILLGLNLERGTRS